MVTQSIFNISPYYDDFDESKNFLRMLFRPGYAVQARELTQAQTILQNQVDRFGSHIFEDGSKVLGAGVTTRPVSFLRVHPSYEFDGAPRSADINQLVGFDIKQPSATAGVEDTRARVIHALNEGVDGNDPYKILVVEFVQGSSFLPGTIVESVNPAQESFIKIAGDVDSVGATLPTGGDTLKADVQGTATLVSVEDGVFFIDGFFVKSNNSFTVPFGASGSIERYFKDPTAQVGFDITRQNVTSSEDTSLLDPAAGTYNFNAPGADRYNIDLSLNYRLGSTGSNDNFIELLRLDDGDVTFRLNKTNYAELEKTLARRTYDESGSYTVRPFEIDVREHLSTETNRGVYASTAGGSAAQLAVGLKPGKAYVFGNEFETQSTQYLTVDKARNSAEFTGSTFDSVHGNFFTCELSENGYAGHWLFSRGDINKTPFPVDILNDGGTRIATANIHKVERDSNTSTEFRVFVYDLRFQPGVNSLQGASIIRVNQDLAAAAPGDTPYDASNLRLFEIIGQLSQRDENILVFNNPVGSATKDLTKIRYRFNRTFTLPVTPSTNPLGDSNTQYSVNIDLTDTSGSNPAKFRFVEGNQNNYDRYTVFYQGVEDPEIPDGTARVTELANVNIAVENDRKTLILSNLIDTSDQDITYGKYILQAQVEYDDTDDGTDVRTGSGSAIRTKVLNTATEVEATRVVSGNRVYYELPNFDVLNIIAVTAGISADNADTTNFFNPADDLLFDNGQRDNAYLNGRLYVKDGLTGAYDVNTDSETAPSITVSYRHFNHTDGPGPFTVDSYTLNDDFTYEEIPVYSSKNLKKTFALANSLDFRHTNPNSDVDDIDDFQFRAQNVITSSRVPVSGSVFVNYNHYLSRVDKVVLKNSLSGDVSFDIIKGTDAISPKAPEDRENSMTLYTLTIPAYTHNPSDVGIKFIENKRYTMKDLGAVEDRVSNLEFFTSVSLLENEIDAKYIDSVDTDTPAFKNGILVDPFSGHRVGDVSHPDYRCAIDYRKNQLRPSFVPNLVGLTFDDIGAGTNLQLSSDGLLTFRISQLTDFVDQPHSTTTMNVNPFNVSNWLGTINLRQDSLSTWYDTTTRPVVKVNSEGENDNWKVTSVNGLRGFGTQWNFWNTSWYGIDKVKSELDDRKGKEFLSQARIKDAGVPVVRSINENNVSSITRDANTTRDDKNRSGILTKTFPDHIIKDVDDKVVDVSIVPFMEPHGVTFSASGLRPNTTVFAFFDGVNVDADCGSTAGLSGPFTTDNNGNLTDITFHVPRGTYETGEKLLRLLDDSNGTLLNATTSADAVYYSQGAFRKRVGELVSTRPPQLRRQTVKSDQIVNNPFTRNQVFDTSKYTNWIDPLAQTFYVDNVQFPSGIFLDSVDLFFASVDGSIPVKVDIRPTINGVPSASTVVPFSEVSKVGVTSDAATGLNSENFKFSSPVFLEPGEYALTVSSNSANYSLYAAEAGKTDLIGNVERVSIPIYSGSLFTPTNTRESEPNKSMNLKYKINRCIFDGSDVSLTLKNSPQTSVVIDEYRLNYNTVLPLGTNVSTTSVFDNNTAVVSGKNIQSSVSKTLSDPESLFTVNMSLDSATTKTSVSPVLDTYYLDLGCFENRINNNFDTTDTNANDELNAFETESGAIAKYITRRVTLEDGFEARNLKVFLDLNQQDECSVEIYGKISTREDETDFDELGYFKMIPEVDTNFVSENEFDFREVSFTLPTNALSITGTESGRVKSFAVKVCMYRPNTTTKVPLIKDLRIVALDT